MSNSPLELRESNTPEVLSTKLNARELSTKLTKRFTPWQDASDFFTETEDARLHKLGQSDSEIEEIVRDRNSFAVNHKRRS